MKAIPKVNIDGLFIEDVITDDAFSGVVPFYADPPASEPGLPPETGAAAGESPGETPEPEVAGYIVGVSVPPGLFHPRFDLVAWQKYQDAVTAAQEAYRKAFAEWSAQPEYERGEPPVHVAPEQPQLWGEGLTLEKIEERTKPKPQEPTELELLSAEVENIQRQNNEQQESITLSVAELTQLKTISTEQHQTIGALGSEQIKQDLSTLDLKQQNNVIGAELVKKDISILDLYMQNQVLGQMLAAMELKLLAKGIGGEGNVQ